MGVPAHSRITAAGAHPDRWLYVLHGIYGSGRNWGSLARRLVEERKEWGVILTDLRLHGASLEGFTPPHTVAACANDLLELERSLELRANAILGHSFGGKVALVRAAAGEPPEQVWIADSSLRTGTPSGIAWKVIEIVRDLPDTFGSREELADAMVPHGYARGVGQWLAMNLERQEDVFRWRLDWKAVEEMLRDFFRTEVWPTLENPPAGTAIHVIRALGSDSIDQESARRIDEAGKRNGRVHLHTIEGGHWINVENPDAVLGLLTERL